MSLISESWGPKWTIRPEIGSGFGLEFRVERIGNTIMNSGLGGGHVEGIGKMVLGIDFRVEG